MKGLIPRADAINEIIKQSRSVYVSEERERGMNKAAQIIKNLPVVDAAPVRRGLWIWDDEGYHCSECFYHAYGETGEVLSGNWHYCPNCGAKMATDEEKGASV